jgi:Protein of unknown function (DUF3551)
MIVIRSTALEGLLRSARPQHICAPGRAIKKFGEKTMNLFLRLGAPAAAIAAVAIFGALTTGSATAGEFCRQDVTGHMTSCGFTSMEQCKAASAGIGGDCFRDPWLANKDNSNPANANAYAPKVPASKAARKAGSAAQ